MYRRLQIFSFMRSTNTGRHSKRFHLKFYSYQGKNFRILSAHIFLLVSSWIYLHFIPNFAIIMEISKRTYQNKISVSLLLCHTLPRVQKHPVKIFDQNKTVVLGNIFYQNHSYGTEKKTLVF